MVNPPRTRIWCRAAKRRLTSCAHGAENRLDQRLYPLDHGTCAAGRCAPFCQSSSISSARPAGSRDGCAYRVASLLAADNLTNRRNADRTDRRSWQDGGRSGATGYRKPFRASSHTPLMMAHPASGHAPLLFDVANDPACTTDIAGEEQDQTRSLAEQLLSHRIRLL